MFYEIRRYTMFPGKRDEFVPYMEAVVVPYQVERGMTFVASFLDEGDPDVFVWIRRFEDEEARQRLYAATYEYPRWTDEIRPHLLGLMDVEKTQVTRVAPTPRSVLR